MAVAGIVSGSVRKLKTPNIDIRTIENTKKLCGHKLGGRRGCTVTTVPTLAPEDGIMEW